MSTILLTGATSHLASLLLPTLLSSPFVQHLILLSRTSISSADILAHPKVVQILVPADFSSADAFSDKVWRQLKQEYRVDAVVWCVGGQVARFASWEEAYAANVEAGLRFLEGWLGGKGEGNGEGKGEKNGEEKGEENGEGKGKENGEGKGEENGEGKGEEKAEEKAEEKGKTHSERSKARSIDPTTTQKNPFRFIYFSTYNAEQNSFASLWMDAKFRRLKGAAEKALLGLAEEKGRGMCEVYCLRIGRVLDGGLSVANVVRMGMGGWIASELVAKKVLALALGGRGGEMYGGPTGGGVLENEEVMGEGWAEVNSVTVAW